MILNANKHEWGRMLLVVLVVLVAVVMAFCLWGCGAVPHRVRADMVYFEYAVFGRVEPWGEGSEEVPGHSVRRLKNGK